MVIKNQEGQDLEGLKKKLLPILKRNQVSRAGIFGSIAEGTARPNSDLDLLVEFEGEKTLFDLVALKLDLESGLNRHVDVSTYRALNHLIEKKVLAREVRVL